MWSEGNDIELAGHQIQIERTAIKQSGWSILEIRWQLRFTNSNGWSTGHQRWNHHCLLVFWQFCSTSGQYCCAEAVDDNNNRQLMIHLPWSNSNVYWDCGNDGTIKLNRINKAALNPEFEGKWHFWTFTKMQLQDLWKFIWMECFGIQVQVWPKR